MASRAGTRSRQPAVAPWNLGAVLLTALLGWLAAWIMVRAALGHFERPIGSVPLLLVACVACGAILIADELVRRTPRCSRGVGAALLASVSLLAVVVTTTLGTAGGSVRAISLAALLPVAVTLLAVGRAELATIVRRRGRNAALPGLVFDAPPYAESPGRMLQELARSIDATGCEQIAGTLRAWPEPGQRTVQFHLAFCPPLAHNPEIEVEQTAGPDARWKVGAAWPFAARIDGKLAATASGNEPIELEFIARAPASIDDAGAMA
ncbi:MAG: hypothetical protein K1X74_12860 [Pirellulales bacterium]|nr:hypothetical protein [Pirellulales bacterium]